MGLRLLRATNWRSHTLRSLDDESSDFMSAAVPSGRVGPLRRIDGRALFTSLILLALLNSTPEVWGQTLLQRCLGVVPGQEPHHPLGPSASTMDACGQLPGWELYQQAGGRYQAGDHTAAARLALQAAQMGNPLAQARLATMYAHGDGVRADAGAALRWMQSAAAQHEPSAEHELGYVYEYGHSGNYSGYGVDDDWDRAASLWQDAASQGLAAAEFDVGRAYQYGIGVPLSLMRATYWYDKAAAQGHEQAKYFAKYLRDNHGFDGSSRDEAERALLGPLIGRSVPFTAPDGITFHHLSERITFVKKEYVEQERAKARANYDMRDRQYKDCRSAGRSDCLPPGPPPR
jgi:uncharacterized protein